MRFAKRMPGEKIYLGSSIKLQSEQSFGANEDAQRQNIREIWGGWGSKCKVVADKEFQRVGGRRSSID
jgi:hypothetical protein